MPLSLACKIRWNKIFSTSYSNSSTSHEIPKEQQEDMKKIEEAKNKIKFNLLFAASDNLTRNFTHLLGHSSILLERLELVLKWSMARKLLNNIHVNYFFYLFLNDTLYLKLFFLLLVWLAFFCWSEEKNDFILLRNCGESSWKVIWVGCLRRIFISFEWILILN